MERKIAEEKFDGSGSFVVRNIQNIHHLKIDVAKFDGIDVAKFDGTNNFSLWRCEVLDALNAQNLEDTLESQEKPTEIKEKIWKKMNRTACGVISFVKHKI